MKRFALLAALVAASAAHAGGNSNDNGPTFGGGGTATATSNPVVNASPDARATATNISNPTAISGSTSGAIAGSSAVSGSISTSGAIAGSNAQGGSATGIQGQSQNANAFSSQGNQQSLSVTSPNRIENTPDATVLISSPTAPCRIAIGVGGSGPGVGFSLGGSVLDEGCDAREDARMLNNLGMKDAAVKRLCAKPEMAAALGAACGAKVSASGAPLVIVDASGKVWERPNEYSSWSVKR